MKSFVVTPAAGKRLIAKGLSRHPALRKALESHTVVIVAGTTNGYVAEELLQMLGQADGFERCRFFRGITLPPMVRTTETGRLPDESKFPGDVVIVKGIWRRGLTLFDIADDLAEGDVVLKGANAINLTTRQAAVLIGHPQGGTLLAIMQAVVGRRVRLIMPAGLEKRVDADLYALAAARNATGAQGPRLWPVPGELFTEMDALRLLTGARAQLFAAGGVGGAEGAIWLDIEGTDEQVMAAEVLLNDVAREPAFTL